MSNKEYNLLQNGYKFLKVFNTNKEAKEYAKKLRSRGDRAQVVTSSSLGMYDYSVFVKYMD